MASIRNQISIDEVNPEYAAFVEKFKAKKTTDDCYTPEPVYNAVKKYAMARYGFSEDQIVRPFWPGADYEAFDYPDGCVVLDNPPFSIISKIAKAYCEHGIRFFLFSPYLTAFGSGCMDYTRILTGVGIIYENGANVDTAYITNMEPGVIARADPELARMIKAANDEYAKQKKKAEIPKYSYPPQVLTAAMMGYMAAHDTAYTVRKDDAYFVRVLDEQKRFGKAIFGGGFLLSEKAASEKAAAEKAAATRWKLSEQERQIIEMLGRKNNEQG